LKEVLRAVKVILKINFLCFMKIAENSMAPYLARIKVCDLCALVLIRTLGSGWSKPFPEA
jgi:hypothetical protein